MESRWPASHGHPSRLRHLPSCGALVRGTASGLPKPPRPCSLRRDSGSVDVKRPSRNNKSLRVFDPLNPPRTSVNSPGAHSSRASSRTLKRWSPQRTRTGFHARRDGCQEDSWHERFSSPVGSGIPIHDDNRIDGNGSSAGRNFRRDFGKKSARLHSPTRRRSTALRRTLGTLPASRCGVDR